MDHRFLKPFSLSQNGFCYAGDPERVAQVASILKEILPGLSIEATSGRDDRKGKYSVAYSLLNMQEIGNAKMHQIQILHSLREAINKVLEEAIAKDPEETMMLACCWPMRVRPIADPLLIIDQMFAETPPTLEMTPYAAEYIASHPEVATALREDKNVQGALKHICEQLVLARAGIKPKTGGRGKA